MKKSQAIVILIAGLICGGALMNPWLSDRAKLVVAAVLLVASLAWVFYSNRRIARLEEQFSRRLAAYLARTDIETRHAVLAQFEVGTRDAVMQHISKIRPISPDVAQPTPGEKPPGR